MIFGKTRLELKVGIFVFIAFIILTVFVLSIGGIKTWTSGYKVNFIFHFVNGIKIGAPVRFSGVDVGQVKRIDFINSDSEEARIQLVCWVKSGIRIPVDSTIWVNTLGLLGEKYVEIMPGRDYNSFLAANQSCAGVDPVPMHEIFRKTNNIVDNLDVTITMLKNKEGTLGRLLYDDSIYKNLDALILDIRNNPWKLFIKQKEKK